MHLRHIDPRSLEWKDAMLDETRPGPESDSEQQLEAAAVEKESGHSVDPPTGKESIGFSAPSR